ncbi:MAG TPA: hypothetical protein H9860_01080 [Candidatus Gemmiger faecavium]|nr:hypothetical protein [Candidatus Gemmiger faecavium]
MHRFDLLIKIKTEKENIFQTRKNVPEQDQLRTMPGLYLKDTPGGRTGLLSRQQTAAAGATLAIISQTIWLALANIAEVIVPLFWTNASRKTGFSGVSSALKRAGHQNRQKYWQDCIKNEKAEKTLCTKHRRKIIKIVIVLTFQQKNCTTFYAILLYETGSNLVK